MLAQTPIDLVVVDEVDGVSYHFTKPVDLVTVLDITPCELAYGLSTPNGTLINDRYVFHKIYIGDLEKLSRDMIVINPDGLGTIVPNARVAAAISGYDIGSIAYALDTDCDLDLPVRFISMDKFIKDMANSFDRQLTELKPQPNLTIKPDRKKVFEMLKHLEKTFNGLDCVKKPETAFLPTQPIGKTNEVGPGEYVITDYDEHERYEEERCDEYKKQTHKANLPNYFPPDIKPDFNNYPRTKSTSLKLIDLALGKELFFASYKNIAKFLGMSTSDQDLRYLRDLRYSQEPINGYLIRLADDYSPLPGPF